MIYSRSHLEQQEEENLAPYAVRSKNTRGRKYPDDEPEYRTVFQRDRDRIIHTTAFRRLEYKTQVFINYEGDYYRTRLTHTLEVAQVGRTIARALGANEDLVEGICLAHDLGHPAFGHSGEVTLNRMMKDFGGFDHNKQSLRIVTKLEHRYPEHPGLNLSWEVLEGIVKHETEYDVSDASSYDPDLRGSLEAQITNVADEMAYTAHDLDDGLRSGMITESMLAGMPLWEVLLESVQWKGAVLDELTRHRIIRRLMGLTISDLIHTTEENLHRNNIQSALDVQKLSFNLVAPSEDMKRRTRELKDFLYKNLYRQYRVMRMQNKAERILTELFQAYAAAPAMLPPHIRLSVEERGLERSVCDYLAGMTDRYAIDEHQKLFDPTILP
jgi:dGTPase